MITFWMSIFINFLIFSDEVTRLQISDEVTLFIGRGDFLIWDEVTFGRSDWYSSNLKEYKSLVRKSPRPKSKSHLV